MWDWFINFLTAVLAGIEGFVGDWGLAVIILTVIIRLILTPLMAHSTKSTARMQVMQPKLQEIQERYADNPERQAEEMRKIYADMKFNPLGGCLPIFLQMPVFFGLFTVARELLWYPAFHLALRVPGHRGERLGRRCPLHPLRRALRRSHVRPDGD